MRDTPRLKLVLLLGLLAVQTAPAQKATIATVTGRVILDANRNGRLDPGETGIAGIQVTDGVRFARTGADGRYSLDIAEDPLIPFRPARVIAVCWPSRLWPVGQRWYVRLGDLEPGSKVDFFLREDRQQLPFTLVHATDPHNDLTGSDLFRDEITRMADHVRFCVMTGDLGYMGRDNADRSFTSIRAFTRAFPVPLLHTPGNHDIVDIHTSRWSEPHPLAGYGPYTRFLGPIRWSFDYAGVHIVGLDWARIAEGGKLETGVADVTLHWLEKDLQRLKEGTRTLLFMHHHWRPDEKFWDLLLKHKVELLLAGHSHRNLDQSRRGVKALTTMNLRGPYRLVTVADRGHVIVDRCFGCKAPDPAYHSKHCQLAQPEGAARARGAVHREILGRELSSSFRAATDLRSGSLEIIANIEPGTTKKYGLRLGPADGKGPAIEIACIGDQLQVGEVRTAAAGTRDQKGTRLHVVVGGARLKVLANHRVRIETAYVPGGPCALTLFSEGGTALFKKVDVWHVEAAQKGENR